MINFDEIKQEEQPHNHFHCSSSYIMQSSSSLVPKPIFLERDFQDNHCYESPDIRQKSASTSHSLPDATNANRDATTTTNTNLPLLLTPPYENNSKIRQQQPWCLQPRHHYQSNKIILSETCDFWHKHEFGDHQGKDYNHAPREQHKTSLPLFPSLSPDPSNVFNCNDHYDLHDGDAYRACGHRRPIPSLKPRYHNITE
mmetsp:Transcript_10978/g.13214  ORF Transcript_10978/g.13214 Transcript_10978/m.13214 type:complete len:199 (-) Transcript_10978:613-1209(-)|eukprot:CAMPEP_0195263862 /NCGR_PEP_ID=MMETSP0706-20130129/10538_1 /TAXON_ID=33640 /ORGANISM="Asterionellopsis glacialis, Strain CCMP134" /LENGTH=198 /DNA_ID=CAMNT_0040318085 /DNA_START=125 /DNA_END=721 /DNA_ORIENTATION=+